MSVAKGIFTWKEKQPPRPTCDFCFREITVGLGIVILDNGLLAYRYCDWDCFLGHKLRDKDRREYLKRHETKVSEHKEVKRSE